MAKVEHITRLDTETSKYLGADDLELNRNYTLTIAEISIESDVTSDGIKYKTMYCVHFKNAKKPWPLNKINRLSLTRKFNSTDVKDWIGKQVVLFRTTTKAFGDPKTPCIRVKR